MVAASSARTIFASLATESQSLSTLSEPPITYKSERNRLQITSRYLFLHCPSVGSIHTKITTSPFQPFGSNSLPRVILSLGSDLPVWKLGPNLAVLDLVLGLLVETDAGLLFLEDEVDVYGVLVDAFHNIERHSGWRLR